MTLNAGLSRGEPKAPLYPVLIEKVQTPITELSKSVRRIQRGLPVQIGVGKVTVDVKAARQQYDCREIMKQYAGEGNRAGMWHCLWHDDRTPSLHVKERAFFCFGCNAHGDCFDLLTHFTKRSLGEVLREHRIDPADEMERKAEYAKREAKRLEAQIEKAQKVLAELRQSESWLRYHEQLDEQAISLWESRGVAEWYQKYAFLGYDKWHEFWAGEESYHSSTLTFPIYQAGSREVLNVRHRLLDDGAIAACGKYRPERSGLPASPYIFWPDMPLQGRTILVEGEIKAMVVGSTLQSENTQVIGLPGSSGFDKPKAELIASLKDCDPIYIVPDPGVNPEPLIKALDKKRIRVLTLPGVKVDDAIVEYGLDLKAALNGARRI